MGITPNLKLATISEQDNPKVKDFFQDLAGDVATSNMQKIDKAYLELANKAGLFLVTYNAQNDILSATYNKIQEEINKNKIVIVEVRDSYLTNDLHILQRAASSGGAFVFSGIESDGKFRLLQVFSDRNMYTTSSFPILGEDGKISVDNMPTLDAISDGTTRKAVTQTEKNTWNAKSDFGGSYNDLTDRPSLNFIPTSDKGVAGGVTPLSEDKKVPETYIPELDRKYVPQSEKGKAGGIPTLNINEHIPQGFNYVFYTPKFKTTEGTISEQFFLAFQVGGIVYLTGTMQFASNVKVFNFYIDGLPSGANNLPGVLFVAKDGYSTAKTYVINNLFSDPFVRFNENTGINLLHISGVFHADTDPIA